MIKRVAFFAYPGKDPKKLTEFYANVVGLNALSIFAKDFWGEIESADGSFFCIDPVSDGAYIAFETDDIHQEVQRLKDQGVEIVKDIWDTGVCHMALAKDPEGSVFMLHQIYPDRE